MESKLESLVNRLEKVAGRLESAGGAGAGAAGDSSATMAAYDAAIADLLSAYVTASQGIGGVVAEQAALVTAGFDKMKAFILMASKSKKPDGAKLQEVVKPVSDSIMSIQSFKDANFRSDMKNHLCALAESCPALGWIAVAPAPAPFVKEMNDSGIFYTNRVLKDYKDKDAGHVKWVKSVTALWAGLQAYVKENHTIGVTYNAQGGEASVAVSAGGAPPPPPPGAAPPPPPPAAAAPPAPSASAESTDTSALFAELNQGSDITKGLKRVTDDMKTHKNPALRTGPAPFKAPKPAAAVSAPKAPAASQAAKPPVVELQGKKWVVEYVNNKQDVVITDTNPKQTVYVFKCTNTIVQVKGKVNAITLDGCKKTAVVFEDAISTIDFINCQSVKCQVNGSVPTVSIEKTDGCQVYLSEKAKNTIIISAKSSEMNVLVPGKDGEFKEYALPEQFRSSFTGSGMTTEPNDVAA